ncbi:MAG TPA: acyl-CoA thioesterase domain-containing protein [Acidimicrobiales bacterium]|nr:acyl-CoA thioesterase domain-containing protein [Acidimicrobiales bacterium]
MDEAGFFEPDGDALVPVPAARGPWAEDMMHGRLLGGLAAWAIDRDHGDPDFMPARLTVDLFKSPGMKETRVSTSLVRAGGRVRIADAFIQVGGVDVARGTALYLRKSDAPVDDAPLTPAWDSTVPGPVENEFEAPFEVRPVDGMGFGAVGPRRTWLRELRPLVTGEPLTPFIRAAVVSDFASPLANSASEGLEYINADLALYMARLPVGEWIGVEYADRVAGDGVSVAHCRLHDEVGPIGSSEVCAVLTPRMARD